MCLFFPLFSHSIGLTWVDLLDGAGSITHISQEKIIEVTDNIDIVKKNDHVMEVSTLKVLQFGLLKKEELKTKCSLFFILILVLTESPLLSLSLETHATATIPMG